jgi:hypothetical protein
VAYAPDWRHAPHHVGLALAAVGPPEAERRRVFKKSRRWLKKGHAAAVLNELERLAQRRGVLGALATPVAYMDKHLEAGRLECDRVQRPGLPVGGGAIESATRRVVNQRPKGNGLMWCGGNAEGMLTLRAAAPTGGWEEALQQALQSSYRDGRQDWHWSSPDMPIQLKAEVPIEPPVSQVPFTAGDSLAPT